MYSLDLNYITDVASVLSHIQQSYTHLGLSVQVEPQQVKSTLASLESLKEGVEQRRQRRQRAQNPVPLD